MTERKPITGNVFIATGEKGLRSFSRDGKTWTHVQTDREGMLLSQICFAGGRCMAAGRYGAERVAFVTRDGLTWDQSKLPGRRYVTRLDILYAEKDRFVAILNEDGAVPGVVHDLDGKKWSSRTPILDDVKVMRRDAHLRRMARGNGLVVVVGDYGARLVRKEKATKLVAVPNPAARDTLIDVAFGNGVFVGGGLHALRMRSKDGLNWTDRVVGEEGEHINAMLFDGRQFIGVGQGATYFSADGNTWKRTPNKNAPTTATFGDGVFVGSLWPGKVLRSTDGIEWKQVHQFPHHVLALAHGQLGKR